MEMRVEELASRSGASVDTIRYYQAKGLLAPPRRQGRVALYDDGHLTRLERIRSLQARGFTLATIARILAGELDAADEALVGALTQESLAEEDRLLSLDELAARTGIPGPLLQAIANEGLLVPNRVGEDEGYTLDDVAVAQAGLTLLQEGIPLGDLLSLARAHHEATVAIARRAVELFDAHVRKPLQAAHEPGEDEEASARRLVEAFQTLLPATATLVAHHFTRVLLQTALEHIEHVGSPTELTAVRAEVAR
ncbi:MAG TPA: MerR family transcriptional regulator [Acidimicrobiales bacterium]|nr:MerR family transcriptional regulator [Acidimicrobiales bacterium]